MINQFQEYCKKYTGYYLKAIDELAVVRCDNLYKKYNGLENPKIIFSKVLIYYYGLALNSTFNLFVEDDFGAARWIPRLKMCLPPIFCG